MSQTLRNQLGGRLRAVREAKRLTQQQLADLLGKSIETISNFERGKTLPSLVTLEQMARVLKVSMGEFFDNKRIVESPSRSGSAGRLEIAVSLLPAEDVEVLTEVAVALERRHRRNSR